MEVGVDDAGAVGGHAEGADLVGDPAEDGLGAHGGEEGRGEMVVSAMSAGDIGTLWTVTRTGSAGLPVMVRPLVPTAGELEDLPTEVLATCRSEATRRAHAERAVDLFDGP